MSEVTQLFAEVRRQGRSALTEPEAKRVLAQAIARLSALAMAFPDTIQEVDINPLVATADRAVALDALIILKENDV